MAQENANCAGFAYKPDQSDLDLASGAFKGFALKKMN